MSCIGLLASYHLNLPSGACMVGCLGLGYVASLVLSPRHGLLGRLWVRRRHFDGDEGPELCERDGATRP
jgi:hypothetical protein